MTIFYIGQPADHVLKVMKRTGRKRIRLKLLTVTTTGSKIHDLSGHKDKIAAAMMSRLKVAHLTCEWWLSCGTILTMARGRRADGSGTLCYRVSKMRQVKRRRPRKRK